MGATAFFTSGAVLYNPLTTTDGALASYDQWLTLDPCYGHSTKERQYHYHAVSIAFVGGMQFEPSIPEV